MKRISEFENQIAQQERMISALGSQLSAVMQMLGLDGTAVAESKPVKVDTHAETIREKTMETPVSPVEAKDYYFKTVRKRDGQPVFLDDDIAKSHADQAYHLTTEGTTGEFSLEETEDAWSNAFDGNEDTIQMVAEINNPGAVDFPSGLKTIISGMAKRTEEGWLITKKAKIEFLE